MPLRLQMSGLIYEEVRGCLKVFLVSVCQLRDIQTRLSVCACPFAQENILRDTVTYTGAQPHLFFYPFASMLTLCSSDW